VSKSSPAHPLVDLRLIKAVGNPTRVDILNALIELGDSSPSKIARRLDHVSVNLVSHHIKVLRELGVVELVDEVRHGGRTERIYRATKRLFFGTEQTTNMSIDDVRLITLDILRMLSADVEKALLGNTFDQLPDNHLSRVPLKVDRQGWAEVVRILDEALEQIEDVGRRAGERCQGAEEEPLDVRVGIMQFVMPDQGGDRSLRRHS
jgi:DNA-binding transcriptional ArsR family regulator